MQLCLTVLLGLATLTTASIADFEGVRNTPRDSILIDRQNAGRPVASGTCCIANTSLKQDACTASNGATGRCVPGGNNCGSTLSCVGVAGLVCEPTILERGKSLCRAGAVGGGVFDGANVIQSINQAKID